MGKFQDIIVINGKTYDVRNRTLKPTRSEKPAIKAPAKKPTKNIDGFITVKQSQRSKLPTVTNKTISSATKPTKPIASRKTHHVAAHKAEKSKILMRSGLKKPRLTLAEKTKELTTPRVLKSNKRRAQRAKTVPKSNLVKRFNPHTEHTAFKHKTALDNASGPASPITRPAQPKTETTDIVPSRSIASAVATTSTVSKSEDLFRQAMASAKHDVYKPAHKSSKKSHKAKKALKVSTGIAIFVAIVGFVLLQNLPLIYIKMASSKAGFAAQVPNYQPSGFTLQQPIKADPGQIVMQYISKSDERNFAIIQKASNWNTKSLLDNFLLSNNKNYQTLEDSGKTIFVYDSNNATWVNGGIWYQLEGNAQLNNEQILRIANGIM